MFSLSSKSDNPIAILLDKDGKRSKNTIYLHQSEVEGGSKHYGVDTKIIPHPTTIPRQADRIGIFGQAGAGKSRWAANYAKLFKEVFDIDQDPKKVEKEGSENRVYLIRKEEANDPEFERINPFHAVVDQKFVESPPTCDEFADINRGPDGLPVKPTLIIFDDFQTFQPPIQKVVNHVLHDILEAGRKLKLYVIVISHIGADVKNKYILGELNKLVVFPSNMSRNIQNMLANHFNVEKSVQKSLREGFGRYVMVDRNFPQFMVGEKRISIFDPVEWGEIAKAKNKIRDRERIKYIEESLGPDVFAIKRDAKASKRRDHKSAEKDRSGTEHSSSGSDTD